MIKEQYIFQIYLINFAPRRYQVINMFSYLTDEAQREHLIKYQYVIHVYLHVPGICNLQRIKKYQLNIFFSISLLEIKLNDYTI